jgi:hypothetical protein
MLNEEGERTFLVSIIPKEVGHINTCFTATFRYPKMLVDFVAMSSSIVVDFRVKTTGMSHANKTLLEQLPIPSKPSSRMRTRALLLNALTTHYSDLWSECFEDDFKNDLWSKQDPRLSNDRFGNLTSKWSWSTPLRLDFERRQALLEIDVLASRMLGLTLDELCALYRIKFDKLRSNEENTWYDQKGRIVYFDGDSSYGFRTTEWKRICDVKSGTIERAINDDTLPGGPRERVIEYVAPFDRCDREADFATAWKFFEENGE